MVSKIKAAFQVAHDKIKPLLMTAIEAEVEAAQAAFQAAQKLIPSH